MNRAIASVRRTKSPEKTVSIVILQYNNPQLTVQCIESLKEHCTIPHEIILVDNDSDDPKARNLGKKLRGIRFVQNETNEGFSKGNNTGAAIAEGSILLFLNNDTIAEEDFITPILKVFGGDPSIGIVGPRLLNRDRTLQLSAGKLPSIMNEMKDRAFYRSYEAGKPLTVRRAKTLYSAPREVKWVTGAALFIRRVLFKKLGGFDEGFFMFFEDKDLCHRARLSGAKVLYTPDASLVHLRGASANSATNNVYRTSQVRYYEKHRGQIEQFLLKGYLRLAKKFSHG
jgi:GT2 family glycosyltransferase